jgi:hypothetical protein
MIFLNSYRKLNNGSILAALLILLLTTYLFYLLVFLSSNDTNKNNVYYDNTPFFVQVNPILPNDLTFAGEKIDLRDPEVRERLDQELAITIHSHASTIMIIKRFYRFKDLMLSILQKEKIHDDFIYLMVAESSVRNATSNMSAQGYWQFLSGTAKEYGLEVSQYVDERNDPYKSTWAACQYLKSAYRQFGNWTMTAASYNHGVNGLRNQMNLQQQNNFYSLKLNNETSRYIFRILAYKILLENPAAYGYNFSPEDVYSPLATRTVEISTSIVDLTHFARSNGTNYKTLVYLNPWILKNSLPVLPGTKYRISLPDSSKYFVPR